MFDRFLDPRAALWKFPSRRLVRPRSLCALCRLTESRGKAASANSSQCPAASCLCEKTRLQPSSTFIRQSQCWCLLLNFFFVCFRRWSADEARILRVSVNSFLDHLSLVLETMEMFGPPVSQWSLTDISGLNRSFILHVESTLGDNREWLWGLAALFQAGKSDVWFIKWD